MQTIYKDNNGTHELSLEALLRGQRVIFLHGEITDAVAQDFARQIFCFAMDDPSAPVKVFLDSPGGEIDAGLVIYDILQSSSVPIELNCIGHAYSMAAILLASGQHGRYLLPHSKVMIHEPMIPYGIGVKTSSVQSIANALVQTKTEMEELLAKHTGQTPEKIAEVTRTDCFFTAEGAVEFGLADGIHGFREMIG